MHRENVRAAVAKRRMYALMSSTEIHRTDSFPGVAKLVADGDSRFMIKRSLCRIQFLRWQPARRWTNPSRHRQIPSLSVFVS